MNLFGFNITKAKKLDNLYLPSISGGFNTYRAIPDTKDQTALLNAYKSWVYVCCNLRASTFASTPLRLYVALPEGKSASKGVTRPISKMKKKELLSQSHIANNPAVMKAAEIEEVVDHRLINTLNTVNPHMNRVDLLEITSLYQDLSGNAYWYLVKDGLGLVEQIYAIPPDRISIIRDPVEFISGYEYRYGTKRVVFPNDSIIHFKYPNPKDVYYGASPLQAVAESFNINENMNTYENSMFANNARMEGYFTSPAGTKGSDPIDEESWERIKVELQQTSAGVGNVGKTHFFSHGIEFKPTSWQPRELGFLKGREWTQQEIFDAFVVPLALFDPAANRANAETANLILTRYGIRPNHIRLESKLNEYIGPAFDEKLFLAFDNVVPEDNDFRLKEDVALQGSGAKSINEVRKERSMEPVEGGDEPLVARGLTPLSQVGYEPAADEDGPIKDIDEKVGKIFDEILEEIELEMA